MALARFVTGPLGCSCRRNGSLGYEADRFKSGRLFTCRLVAAFGPLQTFKRACTFSDNATLSPFIGV